ncbi:MAG: hypothetical protein RLZZ501_430 [Pseudomonadota bacterium]
MTQPEMMAIGDSLYQGVRSMTIRGDLCATSVPAQVARCLGWGEFVSPDPAYPMIIDPEAWLRDPGQINPDLASHATYWQGEPTSPHGHATFDNLSVAGSEVWHLYRYTADNGRRDAHAQFAKLGGQPLGLGTIAKVELNRLVYGVNARYVLNPANTPAQNDKTQIGWVAERRPKRLLVNIGSNNGLWDMCFNGDPATKFYFGKNYGGHGDPDDFTQIEELARALEALPPEIGTIYFNSLGRPRCVPNMMPCPSQVEWEQHPNDGYFDSYENRFALSLTYHTCSAAQMQALDAYVDAVNARIRQILQATLKSHRLVFVDLYALLTAHDSKHYGDVRATIAKEKRIGNTMFESDPWGGMAHGGRFGLDGMHPTTVGYAMVAQEVVAAICRTEGQPEPEIDLDVVCKDDSLINHCPGSWTGLMYLWRDIRRAANPAQMRQKRTTRGLGILDAVAAARAGAR